MLTKIFSVLAIGAFGLVFSPDAHAQAMRGSAESRIKVLEEKLKPIEKAMGTSKGRALDSLAKRSNHLKAKIDRNKARITNRESMKGEVARVSAMPNLPKASSEAKCAAIAAVHSAIQGKLAEGRKRPFDGFAPQFKKQLDAQSALIKRATGFTCKQISYLASADDVPVDVSDSNPEE